MTEPKRGGFFKRLFGIPEEPAPAPSPVTDLPPEFVPASDLMPVAPEPAAPEEVAAEIESAAVETGAPPEVLLHETEGLSRPPVQPGHLPPPGPPETTPDYVEEVEDDEIPEDEQPEPVPGTPDFVETAAAPGVPPAMETERRGSWLQRLTAGLRRSSEQMTSSIGAIFLKRKLDATTLDELEDTLIQADLGIDTAMAITDTLRRDRFDRDVTVDEVRAVLAGEVEKVLAPVAAPLLIDRSHRPFVILMIGVNGSGKTTTIGKLAQKFGRQGLKVLLAAGDTFRAAAIEQLQVWGQRTGAPVVSRPAGSDASGLAFDAVTRAKAEGHDVLIIDTAGRLQNREELMGELEKMVRVIRKVEPSAPHAVLLTLDATTGQNALNQVEIFGKRAGVTGLVMTKLDGTARGGILVAIAKKFGLPVHFIGVGEGVDDLEAFAAKDFAAAIAGKD